MYNNYPNNIFNGNTPNRFIMPSYNQPVMSMYNQQQLQQGVQQPMQQPMPQQISMAEIPISEIKFLTANQIKGYIVDAGKKSLLVDRQNGLAHVMSTDYSGNTQENIFKFETYTPKEEKGQSHVVLNEKQYVKKEELSELLNELKDRIDKVAKQVADKKSSKEKEIDNE